MQFDNGSDRLRDALIIGSGDTSLEESLRLLGRLFGSRRSQLNPLLLDLVAFSASILLTAG